MSYPIKHFRFNQTGAPQLSGTKGAMTAVFDACLVTGFALKGVTSLTWAGGVATVVVDGGHGYVEDDVVLVEGADPAAFNGERRIHVISGSTFTFAQPDPGAATAQGAITVKIAPLNWERVYTRPNVAAYRSRSVESTGYLLRVNHDADARTVRVRGYQSMTDVDTGLEPFPTTTTFPDSGLVWGASDQVSPAAREWTLIGDDRALYFLSKMNPGYGYALYGFGDIVSYKAGDAHGCILIGQETTDAIYPVWGINGSNLRDDTGHHIAKRHFQVGTSRKFYCCGSITSQYFGRGLPFPSPVDNTVHLYKVQLQEEHLRGELPGLLQCVEEYPFAHRYVLKGVPGIGEGLRDVLFHDIQDGRVSIDLTGPWR